MQQLGNIHIFWTSKRSSGVIIGQNIDTLKLLVVTETLKSLKLHIPASYSPIRSTERSKVTVNATGRQLIHFLDSLEALWVIKGKND